MEKMFVVAMSGKAAEPVLLLNDKQEPVIFKTSLDAQYATYSVNKKDYPESRVLRCVDNDGTVAYEEVWERGMAAYMGQS